MLLTMISNLKLKITKILPIIPRKNLNNNKKLIIIMIMIIGDFKIISSQIMISMIGISNLRNKTSRVRLKLQNNRVDKRICWIKRL